MKTNGQVRAEAREEIRQLKQRRKLATDKRKPMDCGPDMTDLPVSEWTDEQIRLGGAWARHEIQHRTDKLCQPYDWRPGWTELSADEIYSGVMAWYRSN